MKKWIFIFLLIPTLCFAEQPKRSFGLSGYIYGGQGVEQVTVGMKKYSIQEKYGTDVYGGEVRLNLFKVLEKAVDKDIFGKWSLNVSFGKNFERSQSRTYYEEIVKRIGLGYQITPFMNLEFYYKEKDQDISVSGTNVDLGLDYVGVALSWRL